MEGELRFFVLATPGSAVAADTAGMSSTEGFAEFAAAGGKMESNPSCFFNESPPRLRRHPLVIILREDFLL